ncbi:MAG: hypothetical protein A3C70_00215 [Candidatus Zambryskibacteria bacterium RIFCSPHIGHO2_02_FULL_43_14]|uniref:Uncharacterized protein n=1 Tax=Candidatus Zambryskibacteria bacterium RIFCSPHIGHO2_02_FULL_43_14 TaxID=1802748 RepID=A0A1G2TFC1_9BACT|nr:MAG: hypothetical protein A2829_03265 [Candidatus Zambryskibacteria bacterium RIFCSPHIGHO2_01_FULL_43_60]OHA95872.1 MAG: hypothetical protein A3C70_00215 [Candidatus Zambryskibacteria bacterium RIFCSPHIGHO2_02_FULL_43_14]OHB03409.1 MAG: hypothetical protein A3B03_02400 [Candidatus Zambryskibacteria bacterium RIFCSPLOWO2_01_FULL_42_41]
MRNNTAIVLLLLSVGLFYTFTNTQYQDVKKLYTLTGEYQNVLQNIIAIAELREALLLDYGTIPKIEIDRISKVLPDNIDTVRLAFDLDGMAARYGVSIKSVQVTVGTNEDADNVILQGSGEVYEKATISFSFVSDYENFMRLLADIEISLRMMNVKSISFRASESGLYDYQISAETYWLK